MFLTSSARQEPAAASIGRSIPSLDGFRAIAIALVIADHMLAANGFVFAPLGSLGVRIFFVLSGYLITRLLLSEMNRTGKIDLTQFYLRRTIRIFPAFLAYIIVLAALSAFAFIELHPHDLLESVTYTVNYFPANSQSDFVRHIWSLSNEEQFYLLWPVCLLIAGMRRAPWLLIAVVVLEPIVRLAVMNSGPPLVLTIDRRFDCLADTLATGCLLACISKALDRTAGYLQFLGSRWFLTIPLLVIAASTMALHPRIYYVLADSVMNIGIALCLDRWIRQPGGAVGRFLNYPWVVRIGIMSYSLYLWQQLFLVKDVPWSHWPFNLILAVAAATGSFYLIEQPFQRLKNRISRRA